MSDRNQAPTSHSDSAVDSWSQRWSEELLLRTAELIAKNEVDFPQDLGGDDQAKLEAKVRQMRRKQLVRFIAGLIAADLADDTSGHGAF